jgi:hypothetical protein
MFLDFDVFYGCLGLGSLHLCVEGFSGVVFGARMQGGFLI